MYNDYDRNGILLSSPKINIFFERRLIATTPLESVRSSAWYSNYKADVHTTYSTLPNKFSVTGK